MKLLLAVVLAVSVIATAKANGVSADIRNVIWMYDPQLQILSAGDVLDANPTIDLEVTNDNDEPSEIWVECRMKGHQNWARSYAKARVVVPGKTVKKMFQITNCHLLLHTPKKGDYDIWIHIHVSKARQVGDVWTKTHLADGSATTTVNVPRGSFRDLCNKPASTKSGLHIMPRLTGPEKVFGVIVTKFTLHENFTFWNQYDHELTLPYRYRVKDQLGQGIEGKFNIIIPAKCHGRLDWWKDLFYTYFQMRPYQFFGWAASCFPYKWESVCKKFNHKIEVCERKP